MTPEEKYKVTSNDFADIFIIYNGNMAYLQNFKQYSLHIMNERYAIAYVPYEQTAGHGISLFGYKAIPSCYGLSSMKSLEESGVERLRQNEVLNLRGKGVLIGVVDTGIDYTNPVFINKDGTSRIVSIWDQTIDSEDRYPEGTYYGTEYMADQINLALKSDNPFDIVPSRDELGHGTALAGIAAGSEDLKNNFSGVVPDSEIAVVKLKQAKPILRALFSVPTEVPCYQENDIMWGVQYLIAVARQLGRPLAICIGLGSAQGSHDGRGSISQALSVVSHFPGIIVTIAAGNEGSRKRHYYGVIDPTTGSNTVELNVGENETGFSMEIWGAAPSSYSIDIVSPSGEYIPRIPEGLSVTREISFVFEKTTIGIYYSMVEAQSGDQLIILRFKNPASGTWRFQVYGRGDIPGTFHIWLPSDSFITEDTYFIQPNPFTTITSPGNSPDPITVTAYDPGNTMLFRGASKGYSRSNNIKPELAAPGVNIICPGLNHEFISYTGTGAAAAHTAGIAAIMLEWGILKGFYPNMSTMVVKKYLIRGAKRSPSQHYPNREWGYGIIDIYNVFNMLRVKD